MAHRCPENDDSRRSAAPRAPAAAVGSYSSDRRPGVHVAESSRWVYEAASSPA